MRITAIEVEGFGVWRDLRLDRFGGELNVLYGANEAGKTTLMQLVRAVFFGFGDARRQRYLSAHRERLAGGALELADPSGAMRLARQVAIDADGTVGEEQVSVSTADGATYGASFLAGLLGGVDETIFNNVFVLGLRDFQKLDGLESTEAANWLYRLSAGLDRVSVVEVLRELETSRRRLLAPGGERCQIAELAAQRDRLREEIDGLGTLTARQADFFSQRERISDEITRLQRESAALEGELRTLELADQLREAWNERRDVEAQLAALGDVRHMPADALARLDAIEGGLRRRRERLARNQKKRKQLAARIKKLRINEALWRQAPRIELLGEQRDWLAAEEEHVRRLEAEIGDLHARLGDEHHVLALDTGGRGGEEPSSSGGLGRLRPIASKWRAAHRRSKEARQRQQAAEASSRELAEQIHVGLAGRPEGDLTAALETVGQQVSQLRRRVQIDERIDQLKAHRQELEEQSDHLVDRQLLPGGVLTGLGAAFVIGAVMILSSMIMPVAVIGSLGWALAVVGLGGAAIGGAGKVIWEKTAERKLAECEKQLERVVLQLKQAREERESLDGQLPPGAGPWHIRLAEAEKHLAALEDLLPLDARRQLAEQEAAEAKRQRREALAESESAQQRWRRALSEAGLPSDLKPKQLRQAMARRGQMRETTQRLDARRQELAARRQALVRMSDRLGNLLEEARLEPADTSPVARLDQLTRALGEARTVGQHRDRLRLRVRRLRESQAKDRRRLRRLMRRRADLLAHAGVADEGQFRQRAVEHARCGLLRARHDTLVREITAALNNSEQQATLQAILDEQDSNALADRRHATRARLDDLRQRIQTNCESRGAILQQLETLASDRRPAERMLELSAVETRLAKATRRWQVLSATHGLLDQVRRDWEQHRQPKTLTEASGYLQRLTAGRYRRVWTPLGEDILYVDDARGNALSAEMLSRGTREQLFLSLRLALAASYAERGATLPLVLDDVLVNFDVGRARAAAEVLRDFAAAGHQLLLFTCHEHIVEVFTSLDVPTRELPTAGGQAAKTARRAQRKPKRRKTPAPVAVSSPDAASTSAKETPAEAPAADPPIPAPSTGDYVPAGRWPDEEAPLEKRVAAKAPPPAAPVFARPPLVDEAPYDFGFWSDEGAEEFAGEFGERLAGGAFRVRQAQQNLTAVRVRRPAADDRLTGSSGDDFGTPLDLRGLDRVRQTVARRRKTRVVAIDEALVNEALLESVEMDEALWTAFGLTDAKRTDDTSPADGTSGEATAA